MSKAEIILSELNIDNDYIQYCKLLAQLTSIDYTTFTQNDFANQLNFIKSNPLHKIIIAKTLDNQIIGTITILIEPKFIHNLSKIAHIEDVVVDINYRTIGIGKLLIEKAINIAKEYDCYKIILDCSIKNAGFYQKFGFAIKESQMALYLD